MFNDKVSAAGPDLGIGSTKSGTRELPMESRFSISPIELLCALGALLMLLAMRFS